MQIQQQWDPQLQQKMALVLKSSQSFSQKQQQYPQQQWDPQMVL